MEKFKHKEFDRTLLKPDLEGKNPNNFFYNKKVVFTGDLNSIERADAIKYVSDLGADVNTGISRKTEVVVMGERPGPAKIKLIFTLMKQGVQINVMFEEEFLSLLMESSQK